jgi:hypothetical protein
MIKKYQVLVREVYESEETETIIVNVNSQEEIASWKFSDLTPEEKRDYVKQEVPTGKNKLEISNSELYQQVFNVNDLKIEDLVLYLNRVK